MGPVFDPKKPKGAVGCVHSAYRPKAQLVEPVDSFNKLGSLQPSGLACLEPTGPVSGVQSEGSFQITSPPKVQLFIKRKERGNQAHPPKFAR